MSTEYIDDTHINDSEFQIDNTKLVADVEKLAKYILTKMYGIDVRKSISLALELMSNIVVDDQNAYKQLQDKVDKLSQTWNDQVENSKRLTDDEFERLTNELDNAVSALTVDSELKDSRVGLDGTIYPILKNRLDSMEMSSIQHRDMKEDFELDYILQISNVSTTSKDMSYEVISEAEDINEQQFAFRSLRSAFIKVESVVDV